MLDGLETTQARLIAATPELVAADLAGQVDLGFALGAAVPREWPPATWPRHHLVWLRERLAEHPQEIGWWPAYLVSHDEVLVGVVGVQGPPDDAGTVELTYALVESSEGLGYAAEAVAVVVDAVLARPEVSRVVAVVRADDEGARAVLEPLGFVPEDPAGTGGRLRYALSASR